MPIDIDRFEAADDVGSLPTSERVLQFLADHPESAYTRREIAAEVDASPETVGTNLTRLKERGLVRHRAPHWAVAEDRERVKGALGSDQGEAGRSARDVDEWEGPTSSAHRDAATAFAERVRERLDDRLEELYLFGSVARGDAGADSDVDVLAVLAADADYAAVDDELLDLAYDVQLERDVRIEVHLLRADEFAERNERGDPFVRRVVEEGSVVG